MNTIQILVLRVLNKLSKDPAITAVIRDWDDAVLASEARQQIQNAVVALDRLKEADHERYNVTIGNYNADNLRNALCKKTHA